MSDILVTGMPRSGTTLIASLLDKVPNTVALAEPIILERHGDRARAVAEIAEFLKETRRAALAGEPVINKLVNGTITDNWVEPPNSEGRLRLVLERRGLMSLDRPLSADFTLVVKHPAEFTALADLLVEVYPLYAVVRDPLAVLAAWQTVNMPVNDGHMPMAEAFAPDLKRRLADIPDRLQRQVTLIEWQLRTYAALPPGRVIRYEDIIEQPRVELGKLLPISIDFPPLQPVDPVARYAGIDFPALIAALRPLRALIEPYYPEVERRWAVYMR